MITVKADQYRRVTLPGIRPGQVFALREYPKEGEIRLAKLRKSKNKARPDASTIELAAYWEECGPAPDVILPNDKV